MLVCAGGIGGENVGATASGRNRLVIRTIIGTKTVTIAGVGGGYSSRTLGNGEGWDG